MKRRNDGKRAEMKARCNFGSNLKMIRTACRLSQDEVAIRMGVAASQISLWEKGETEIGAFAAAGLAEIFGVTVGQLLGLEPITKADLFRFYMEW